MIKNLTAFGMKRTSKEAMGFFFAYLLIGLIMAGLLGGLSALLPIDADVADLSSSVGIFFSVVYTLALYFIIYTKKQLRSLPYLLLGIIAAIIAYFLGIIIPLIIIAILTTKGSSFVEDEPKLPFE